MPERDKPSRKRTRLPAAIPPDRFIEIRVPRGYDFVPEGMLIEIIGEPDNPIRRLRVAGEVFNRELARPDDVIRSLAPRVELVGEAEGDEKVLRFGPEDILMLETNEHGLPRPRRRRIPK